MPSPEYLTAAQVADLKGVGRRSVIGWAASGILPVALRLPGATGALLFDPEVVADFVAPSQVEPETAA